MEITPLRDYPRPAYPTATVFHKKRHRLMRHIPRRWRYEKTVGSILAFTILSGLCACSLQNGEDTERDATRCPFRCLSTARAGAAMDVKASRRRSICRRTRPRR